MLVVDHWPHTTHPSVDQGGRLSVGGVGLRAASGGEDPRPPSGGVPARLHSKRGGRHAGLVLRLVRTAALCVGTVLLLVGAVAGVVNHEVLDADRFAAHADTVRTDPDVARALGSLLTERLLEEQPDLGAYRPLIETTAAGVVSSRALGPLVRRSLAPLYKAIVLGEHDPTVLHLADVGAVLVAALTALAPQLAVALPADLDVRLSDLGAGEHSADLLRPIHLVRLLSWLAPLAGLLVLGAAGALAGGERRLRLAAVTVGQGLLGAGGTLAVLLLVAEVVLRRSDPDTLEGAVRLAAWDELATPFWIATAGTAGVGAVIALTSGASTRRSRTLLGASLLAALGLALLIDPVRVATALLWVAGAVLLVTGLVLLVVTLTRTPPARGWVLAAVATVLIGVVAGAWPGDHTLTAARSAAAREGCNGHPELCDRRYNDVAFPATHNSMSAADEPGWFYAEQPHGILDQLDAGIRVLLIDSWYGRRTNRAGYISTAGAARSDAIANATAEFGEAAVNSALRLEKAIGLAPRGQRSAYLCHDMCELGSTPWRESLDTLRSWLVAHPREVVTLFVQDEVSPADTAALVEQAGLLPDVYAPTAGGKWPTLGEMIDSGKRLVVLMENHGGGDTYPWLLRGFDWVQDTPYYFTSPAALITRSDTCGRNRGAAEAPLLLVNHWVTDQAKEVTNAARVNARPVLGTRVARCRQTRHMLPNYVAVDLYNRGDLFAVVDDLNDVH
ncbi:hypothetical protein [Nocardioides sp. CER19]|uniref:hypothetical protein n=1 Tax=Nocardioides sp. CER19 TaxID=3038538 RepID=UPI00244CF416|nr:hypothetical protein [Nocardioides sp. CER19]MDH2413895.1 hypothetical protein [Nocardioides sp. CER19]